MEPQGAAIKGRKEERGTRGTINLKYYFFEFSREIRHNTITYHEERGKEMSLLSECVINEERYK